jgi:GNAT superfamily N-acetyltransferase
MFPYFSSVRTARTFILNDLFVCPAGRRAGFAGALLLEPARFAHAVGAIRLTLSTAHTNVPAQKLCQSLGWKLDQDFRSYVLTIQLQRLLRVVIQRTVRGGVPASFARPQLIR